jgi:hypothetical protein
MDYRYDAFISFGWKDLARARRLHERLKDRGYITWYAEKDTRAGDELAPTQCRGIERSRYFFVLHTKHYADGRWAAQELDFATAEEGRSGVKKVVLLRYDETPVSDGLNGRAYVDFTDRRRKPFEQLAALLDEASEGIIRGVGKAMREATDINEIRDCAHRLSAFARLRAEHQSVQAIADILLSLPTSYHVTDSAAWALGDIAVWATTREFVEDIKKVVIQAVATGNARLIDKMAYICGEMAAAATDAGLRQWAQDYIDRNAVSDVPSIRDPFAFTVERILEIRPR